MQAIYMHAGLQGGGPCCEVDRSNVPVGVVNVGCKQGVAWHSVLAWLFF
jgi:hypothetical protein